MKKNEKLDPNWHCVEFQRKVREEMSELYFKDREKYMKKCNDAMNAFIARQEKIWGK
jgi:hypothetical protein